MREHFPYHEIHIFPISQAFNRLLAVMGDNSKYPENTHGMKAFFQSFNIFSKPFFLPGVWHYKK